MSDIIESRVFTFKGCHPLTIVLRYLPEQSPLHPYVVHTRCWPADGLPVFHVTGDYYQTLEEAAVTFGERALHELRKARAVGAAA